MKAISMWQPWASLWLTDAKEHETRGRDFHYRGWVLVQAAKALVSDCGEELDGIVVDRFGPHWRTQLPRGAIIGAVKVVDVQATALILERYGELASMRDSKEWTDIQCGNFAPRRYGIRRREFKLFNQPIPYRGMQAVPFDVPDEIVREAMAA